MIVAIDGEVGSGKTTVSSLVAERLDMPLLESGSIYRALAWKALRERTDIVEDALAALAKKTDIRIRYTPGGNTVSVDGTDVTGELRSPEIDRASSSVSQFQHVRDEMMQLQKKAAEQGDLVAEGRDMGTVVFPDAEFKFFLTASIEVRTERRRLQLEAKGVVLTADEVRRQIEDRDMNDTRRIHSPLMPAKDAIRIETSAMDAEATAALILEKIEADR